MRIEGQAIQNRQLDVGGQNPVRTSSVAAGSTPADDAAGVSPEDSVQISEEARALMSTQTSVEGGNQAARPEMVERARSMLQTGEYNDRAILEKTAERVGRAINLDV